MELSPLACKVINFSTKEELLLKVHLKQILEIKVQVITYKLKVEEIISQIDIKAWMLLIQINLKTNYKLGKGILPKSIVLHMTRAQLIKEKIVE